MSITISRPHVESPVLWMNQHLQARFILSYNPSTTLILNLALSFRLIYSLNNSASSRAIPPLSLPLSPLPLFHLPSPPPPLPFNTKHSCQITIQPPSKLSLHRERSMAAPRLCRRSAEINCSRIRGFSDTSVAQLLWQSEMLVRGRPGVRIHLAGGVLFRGRSVGAEGLRCLRRWPAWWVGGWRVVDRGKGGVARSENSAGPSCWFPGGSPVNFKARVLVQLDWDFYSGSEIDQ